MSLPVLGPLFDFLVNHALALFGGAGALFLVVVTWFAKKYLVPFLELEKHRRYARYIAAIADEVTDELVLRYPGESWAKYLDQAVDRIIEICGIDLEVAKRAALASMARKK